MKISRANLLALLLAVIATAASFNAQSQGSCILGIPQCDSFHQCPEGSLSFADCVPQENVCGESFNTCFDDHVCPPLGGNCLPGSCSGNTTGTYPNCEPILCPEYTTGTYPDCRPILCPSGTSGNLPDCIDVNECINNFGNQICGEYGQCQDNYYGKPGVFDCNCDEGYEGGSTNTSCRPVDCGTPPALENGSVVSDSTLYNTEPPVYSCDTGYNLAGDPADLFCGADGVWYGALPNCDFIGTPLEISAHVKKESLVTMRFYGSESLDVRDIDKATVRLNEMAPALKEKNGKPRCSISTAYDSGAASRDDYEDMTCKFNAVIVACDGQPPATLAANMKLGTNPDISNLVDSNVDVCVEPAPDYSEPAPEDSEPL